MNTFNYISAGIAATSFAGVILTRKLQGKDWLGY